MLTEEQFLKDVSKHVMRVTLDDGLNRRLDFGEPGTFIGSFSIITSRGLLFYFGDMGAFAFSRLPDMFEFFRQPAARDPRYRISPQYWAEKCIAQDKHTPIEVFSEERWERAVRRDVKQYLEPLADRGPGEWFRVARQLWPEAKEQVIQPGASDVHEAVDAAYRFGFYLDGDAHQRITPFGDFWEHKLTEYSSRFLWCCYAMVWAIQQYDATKSAPAVLEQAGA